MGTTADVKSAMPAVKIVSRFKGAVTTVIERLREIVRQLSETDCDTPDTWRDPLSHPTIRAMSARELADLPFSAGHGKRRGS